MRTGSLDAVVFGAGPAGCAAAIALRKCGRSVAMLDRASQPGFKVGEHLRPEAIAELDSLNLPVESARYTQQSPGIRVVWGSRELRERDYLFDHRGAGWNVSRREMESALIRGASESGATVVQGASSVKVCRESDDSWRIDVSVKGSATCLRARWLLDATGRRASVARRMGARREPVDRSVALVGRLDATRPIPGTERLLVEAAADGWWYSVALPDGSLTVVYVTDSDLLPRPARDASRVWFASLESTEHTRERTAGTKVASPISVHGAGSAFLTPVCGRGWVAVGDAAWSSDPLAGIGVLAALQSGRSTAEAVDAACSGDSGPLAEQARALSARIDVVLGQLLDAYRQELRWADRPFWRRRHVAPHRIAPVTLLPDALVRLAPSSSRQQPALGIAPDQLETLLTLAPTPRPAADVLQEFTARCPVEGIVALRALQALAEVVNSR